MNESHEKGVATILISKQVVPVWKLSARERAFTNGSGRCGCWKSVGYFSLLMKHTEVFKRPIE